MQPGTTLGHFRITAPLGAGGMGEVYRATDEKLRREVAIKILPQAFAADPERLARFEREARALAALNHRAIAAVYSVDAAPLRPPAGETGEEAPSPGTMPEQHFLVMELVPGETLAHRLANGPLPIGEAITLARQIAEALEAAHAKGIVHRDLKPGNVMVTPEGAVKVLDFGLAKALAPTPGSSPEISHSPTLTLQATQQGILLGTAAYMSPEQARGEEADARSDLWSFGVVLWEMITGRRPFTGDTLSDTLAEVLKVEPPWEDLPSSTPEPLRRLLRRCLVKNPRDRQHSAADARIALADLDIEMSRPAARPASRGSQRRPSFDWRRVGFAIGGLLVGAALAVWLMWRPASGQPTASQTGHFSILTAPEAPVLVSSQQPLAVSPDGRTIVYVGPSGQGDTTQLYLRDRDDFEAHVIPGTQHGTGPFFSPDGKWIGYFDQVALALKKIPVRGGAPVDLVAVSREGRGGSWGADDRIVFAPSWISGLFLTSSGGANAQRITEPDTKAGVKTHRYPMLSPDERAVLYTQGAADILSFDDADIVAYSLKGHGSHVLVQGGSGPVFLQPNILVYSRAGQLFAAEFDSQQLQLPATPIPVLDGVLTADALGVPTYAVSQKGDLIYLPGRPDHFYTRLVSIDLHGNVTPLPLDPRLFASARFSPDGKRLALNMEGADATLWLYDLDRGTLTRLTHQWDTNDPVWSPDGGRIAADFARGETVSLVVIPADGSAAPTTLVSSQEIGGLRVEPSSWSADGRWLAFTAESTESGSDIWLQPLDPPGKPKPFLQSSFNEAQAVFSPDGKWVAYQSDETGRFEIYVRPVEGQSGATPISARGGHAPLWSRDGRRLYYREDNRMMAVDITMGSRAGFSRPRELFRFDEGQSGASRIYDLAPDGTHFIDVAPGPDDHSLNEIRVILDWGDEVRAKLANSSAH